MSTKETGKAELEKKIEELTIKLQKADESCKNSREKFQKALLASHDAVCIIDLESHKFIDFNQNFTDTFGYSRQESLGKTAVELGIWTDPGLRKKLLSEISKKGCVKNFEVDFTYKDGSIGNVIITSEKIISEGKDCLLAYLRTVTELRKQESQYKLLAQNSTDVIWILQVDGHFSYVSPSVKNLRGYTPEEVLKQSFKEVMTEESGKKVSILLKTLIESTGKGEEISDSFQTEVEHLCKDGSTVWTEVLVTPIRKKDGSLKEVLGVSRNIQGKRYAQQKAELRTKTIDNIFRSAPTGMGMVTNRVFSFVNDKFCEILGYTRKDFLGKDARFLYETEEEYLRVGKVKYEKIRKAGTGALNTRMVKKDGSVIDVYMSSTPIDISDWTKGMIFNVLDLSTIREAETQLEVNKKKYSSLFDHINDAILVHPWKEEGFANFIEVNEVACRMYGYSREEFMAMKADHVTVKEDIKLHSTANFREKITTEGSMVFETTHIHRNGTKFPVEISSNIIELNNEKLVLAVVRNISERKEAEISLVESENKHREMFENSPEAMMIIDKAGFITDCNSAFFKISGRQADDIVGKHFSKSALTSPKRITEYLAIFKTVLLKRENQAADFEWITEDGNHRTGVAHLGPILSKGKVVGIQALVKDTTQQIEFERNLVMAKEKAEENNRLKTAFLETMSHELRTPLNAVIGFSNLIEDEKDLNNIYEMNKYISENGKKLLSIIESIFEISILETHSARIKNESVNINKLFSELEVTVNGMIELDRKNDVNAYFQPERGHENLSITTDRNRLKMLLTNLLTNAIRFTDKGSVRYGYIKTSDKIEFFVSDTGIGIANDKLDLIFEKFRQLDYTPTRTRGGMGLGLAICQEISKLLKGSLRVESSPGEGSTFYFSVPLNPELKTGTNNFGFDLSGKCFLVVEDVESNFLYLEKLLSDAGADIKWAQTGEEAISIASVQDSIDMVLMDIRMPDMNGYDITRAIKKLKPGLPILAQTAYALKSDQQEAFDAGCCAHISKPIRIEDLKNAIKDYLPADRPKRMVI